MDADDDVNNTNTIENCQQELNTPPPPPDAVCKSCGDINALEDQLCVNCSTNQILRELLS